MEVWASLCIVYNFPVCSLHLSHTGNQSGGGLKPKKSSDLPGLGGFDVYWNHTMHVLWENSCKHPIN